MKNLKKIILALAIIGVCVPNADAMRRSRRNNGENPEYGINDLDATNRRTQRAKRKRAEVASEEVEITGQEAASSIDDSSLAEKPVEKRTKIERDGKRTITVVDLSKEDLNKDYFAQKFGLTDYDEAADADYTDYDEAADADYVKITGTINTETGDVAFDQDLDALKKKFEEKQTAAAQRRAEIAAKKAEKFDNFRERQNRPLVLQRRAEIRRRKRIEMAKQVGKNVGLGFASLGATGALEFGKLIIAAKAGVAFGAGSCAFTLVLPATAIVGFKYRSEIGEFGRTAYDKITSLVKDQYNKLKDKIGNLTNNEVVEDESGVPMLGWYPEEDSQNNSGMQVEENL